MSGPKINNCVTAQRVISRVSRIDATAYYFVRYSNYMDAKITLDIKLSLFAPVDGNVTSLLNADVIGI